MMKEYFDHIDNHRAEDLRRFLESAEEALVECKRIERRVQWLRLQCEKMVRQEGFARPSEELLSLWKQLEEERMREMDAIRTEMAQYRAVKEFIDAVPDPMGRTILRRRYLDGENTWKSLCQQLEQDGIFYSQRQVQRFYAAAMEFAQSLWDGMAREAVSA